MLHRLHGTADEPEHERVDEHEEQAAQHEQMLKIVPCVERRPGGIRNHLDARAGQQHVGGPEVRHHELRIPLWRVAPRLVRCGWRFVDQGIAGGVPELEVIRPHMTELLQEIQQERPRRAAELARKHHRGEHLDRDLGASLDFLADGAARVVDDHPAQRHGEQEHEDGDQQIDSQAQAHGALPQENTLDIFTESM